MPSVLRFALALLGTFLLTSLGGAAVYAAPVTVPLFVIAARRASGRLEKWGWALLTGLTMAEVGWVMTFLAVGEADPEIWLVPLLLGIAGAVAIMTVTRSVPIRA